MSWSLSDRYSVLYGCCVAQVECKSAFTSGCSMSNTSTLPRIVGMSHRPPHIPDHEVVSPNSSMTRVAGQVTREPLRS
eukprot:5519826-Amphidinium_carterae.1